MSGIPGVGFGKREIVAKRQEIIRLLKEESANIKDGTISRISTIDLRLLFQLYDRIFFDYWFSKRYKGQMRFSLSRRMTKSAGMTICPKNFDSLEADKVIMEIRLGVDFFFQFGMIDGSKMVCGVKAADSLEALLLVFEHELCHVIEMIHFKETNCGKERFKSIASGVFSHTESHHRLPTNVQIAKDRLGLSVGDQVTFDFDGKRLKGILNRISKRGTVLVKDDKGQFVDKAGNRYLKYYVPLTLLRK